MQNNNNKVSNFFKKEGFYVVLFVCLCVVATAAVFVSRSNKKVKSQPPSVEKTQSKKDETTNASAFNNEKINVDNAKQVTNSDASKQTADTSTKSVATSTTPTLSFAKPVVGKLILGYSEDPVEFNTDNKAVVQELKSIYGNYISCKVGQDVFAAEGGVVDSIDNTKDGKTIVIKHINGFKTVYSNLDDKVSVEKGKAVTKGAKIGVIGKTALNIPSYQDLTNGFLFFKILNNEKAVDPSQYIKF